MRRIGKTLKIYPRLYFWFFHHHHHRYHHVVEQQSQLRFNLCLQHME